MYNQPDPLANWREQVNTDNFKPKSRPVRFDEENMQKILDSFLGVVSTGRSKLELVTKLQSSVVYEDGDNKITIRVSIPAIDRDSLRITVSDEQVHLNYKVKDLKTSELSSEKYYSESLDVVNKKIVNTSATYVDGIVEVVVTLETDKDAVIEVKLS